MKLYPNPCNDYLVIDVTTGDQYNTRIYDVTGCVLSQTNNLQGTSKLDTDALPIGMYILKIEDKLGNYSYKRFFKE